MPLKTQNKVNLVLSIINQLQIVSNDFALSKL